MTKKSFIKRLVPLIISFVLVLSNVAFAAPDNTEPKGNDNPAWEIVDNGTIEGLTPGHADPFGGLTTDDYLPNGDVRVSIIVDGKSTMEAGFDTNGIGTNPSAKRYRGEVLANQKAIAKKISKEALGNKELDVVWNLTLAANIISANVPAIKIDAIKAVDGVVDVIIENQYEPSATVEADDPNMSVASGMTGIQPVWASGYTGAGSKVAIIDTGLDTDHQSFAADAFDYAIEQTGKEVDLLDAADIEAVYDQLNIKDVASASDFYLTSKVPFAANYVDLDLDVTHDNDKQGEHGSHVAGIAAANRYVNIDGEYTNALESVLTQGEAPDAQLYVMKVFGKGGGAYDSDYMAAIEDAIILGADSVNLSLGSSVAGLPFDEYYDYVLEEMAASSTVVTMSAGNNGSWADQTYPMGYLYTDDANLHTGGSPGSFANSFTVASVDNDGFTGAYLEKDGNLIFYTETLGEYSNSEMASIPGDYDYVYVDGPGAITDDNDAVIADQFTAVADKLNGVIAICNRGTSSFFQKANAAASKGAAAVIIANNQAGTINMNLTGYEYTIPAVAITLADGALLKELADSSEEVTYEVTGGEAGTVTVYYGKITVGSDVATVHYDADDYTMSDFSSWGVPGDLSLKPEITAPGGNIYSVNGAIAGGQAYENMSGTSMAAPQIAGLAAVFKQYLRENDIAAKTGLTERQLTNSLFMSTATPLIEADSESYYSVMKQGAGLVDIESAMNAKSYIMMDDSATKTAADGKIKVELGDDPERTGSYSAAFSVSNMSEEPLFVTFGADFFTQDIFGYYTYDTAGNALADEAGNPVVSTYTDTWTIPLSADITWYVNGTELCGVYDFNGDGAGNEADVQALLDYVTGNRDEISNEELADIDGDGDIDTYDAYLALQTNAEVTCAYIPAGGSIDVSADFEIPEAMYYDDNGTYIEGYLYTVEADEPDGAAGVTHSIPVLGYYGDWSEPSMTDKGSALEYAYGEEDRVPYLVSALGDSALGVESFLIRYAGDSSSYLFGGNPYEYDEEYLPERNAMNSNDTISAFRYTLIRNSAGGKFTVDDGTDTVFENQEAGKYAAYYYQNEGKWYNTYTSFRTDFTPSDVAEGTALNMSVTLAPTYYLKDGQVDWDALSENATISMPVVIDNTAPEIKSVEFVKDEETDAVTAIQVTVADNEYIAAIGLFTEDDEAVEVIGSDPEAEKGAEAVYTFDVTDREEAHYYVSIGDYAMNQVLYKINLNAEELEAGVTGVTVDPDEALVIAGNTIKLTASVEPWGIDDAVTWTSSDESIATVDENGIVTGVAEGIAVITVASVLNPEFTAEAEIEVITIDKVLNGIVWDEEGRVWFSEFNLNSLPNYTKLSGNVSLPIASLAYDENKSLYGVTYDSEEDLSSLYVIDEETFEPTKIGDSSIAYWDIAAAPALSEAGTPVMMGIYASYVVVIDMTTGDYLGAFDLSSYMDGSYFVGIAYEEIYNHPTYGDTDWYFLVDDQGNLYNAGFLPYNGSYSRFNPSNLGGLGYTVDTPYFQSLYYDGTSLYWSRYNAADNLVNMVMVNDLYNDGSIYSVGEFNDGVWPVGGLYERDKSPAFETGSAVSINKSFELDEAAFVKTVAKVAAPSVTNPKGGLNAVIVDEDPEEANGKFRDLGGEIAQPQGSGIAAVNVDIAITPDEIVEGEKIHNGLYAITWDPEAMKLVSNGSVAEFRSVNWNDEEGTLCFGYVDTDGFTPEDTVLQLRFQRIKDVDTEITITTVDNGSENPGNIDKYEFAANGAIETGSGLTAVELPTEEFVTIGETVELVPTFTPEDALDKTVTFTSSDPKIATVSEDGVVTGVSAGLVTITVTTNDGGLTAQTLVRVLFKDVPMSHNYSKAVYWANDMGIAAGYSNGNFGIRDDITRGQVVMFLWRAAGNPEPAASTQTFSDVPTKHAFYKAIQWAVEQGITGGYTGDRAGQFGPSDNCTRGQIATFLWRYAGKPAPEGNTQTFSDVKTSSNFYKAIQWASEQGITAGYSDGTFGVNLTCTRGHCVTFLYRMLGSE